VEDDWDDDVDWETDTCCTDVEVVVGLGVWVVTVEDCGDVLGSEEASCLSCLKMERDLDEVGGGRGEPREGLGGDLRELIGIDVLED
jgi:hypothetical protein